MMTCCLIPRIELAKTQDLATSCYQHLAKAIGVAYIIMSACDFDSFQERSSRRYTCTLSDVRLHVSEGGLERSQRSKHHRVDVFGKGRSNSDAIVRLEPHAGKRIKRTVILLVSAATYLAHM